MNHDTLARELVLFDFQAAYEQDPEQALNDLRLLITDRDACLKRVAWLRKARTLLPESTLARLAAPYSDLVLQPERLFALEGSDLTAEQVEELHRLCGDPDALWLAHQVLTGAALPSPAPAQASDPATEWTRLAQDPNGAHRVIESLAEYAPLWLAQCGVDRRLAPDFVAYAQTQLPIAPGTRFRDAWPVWLVTFAARHGRTVTPEDLVNAAPRVALHLVLDQQATRRVPWLQRLIAIIREQLPPTAEDLAGVQVTATEVGTDERTLKEAWRNLQYEIETHRRLLEQTHDLLAA